MSRKALANHKHKPALKPGCGGSLPPQVGGKAKGRLHVHAVSLEWVHSIEPPSWTLAVRLRWWGEDKPGTVFRLPVRRGGKLDHAKVARGYLVTHSSYNIKSSHPKFAAYLHDMQPLVLEVGLGRVSDSSLCVGTATVSNIEDLAADNSVEGEYPVVDRDGVVLAQLKVHFHLEMHHSPLQPSSPPQSARPPSPPQSARPPSPPQGRTVRFDIPEELSTNGQHAAVEGSSAKVPPWVLAADPDDMSGAPPTEGVEPGDLLYERLLQKSHKLRESMVRSLLSSEDVWEGVERRGQDLEWEEAEDNRVSREQLSSLTPHTPTDVDQTQPLPLGGLVGRVPEGGDTLDYGVIGLVTDGGVGQWVGPLGQAAEESDSEMDLTLSSESSNHPLHDQSLLDKLIYTQPSYASDSDSGGEVLPSAVVVEGEEEEEAQLAQGVVMLEEGEGSSDGDLNGEKESTKGKAVSSGGRRRVGRLSRGLGRAGQLREGRILKLLGLERLTALGRVGAVRVEVGRLELDQTAFLAAHNDITPSAYLGSVLFVEYHFPVIAGQTSRRAQEVMRVASRKMAGTGVVSFNHCSLFPASFTRKAIFEWWQETVVFRVYTRLPQQRTPRLIGKSSIRLQSPLRASGMELESALSVHPTDLSSAFSPACPGQTTLGTLTVKLQLIPKGGRRGFPRAQPPPATSQEACSGDSPSSEDDGDSSAPMEQKVVDACPPVPGALMQPPPRVVTLHLLLFLPEAVDLTVQSATDVVWSSSQPQFNHRLVFPLVLSASLLTQLCNGVMVAEVWHKTAGTSTEDQLLGLVKVSLSQFHVAFADDDLLPSLLEAEYPVIAMDSYCPITNPLTGSTHGHLGVILALGSSPQVSHLMQHYAGGKFLLRRPYPIAHSRHHHGNTLQQEAVAQQVGEAAVGGAAEGEVVVVHSFEVTVESVRGLPALNTAVWGEADCYVQYHFPGLAQPPQEEETASLGPQEACPGESSAFPLLAHRTPTVLCIPDPVLDQSQCHALPLPPGRPVQHVLLAAYPSHGVPFEVWKRFYYPNTRDQLVAKGHLPLAKLCALVTMRRVGDPGRGQPFTIPLTPTGPERGREEAGVLHVRVAYSCEEGGGRRGVVEEETSSLITLSVGVLRACGLKEAAEMSAAEKEPLLMGQPAREGVNAFVKLQLPQVIAKNIFETKAVARSFCPEFSHHFAIALPLGGGGGVKQALAESLQKSKAVFEVWHKVDQTAPQTSLSGGITSRYLQHPPKEVLLGVTEVLLGQLLVRETGVHGWLPIVPSPVWSTSVGVGTGEGEEVDSGTPCLGGLEVALSFASKQHRELVLRQACAGGWSPKDVDWGGCECVRWHLSVSWVQVSEDSVHYHTSSLHKLCYLRYKVYDRKPTVTAAHRAVAVGDGRALFRFSHSAVTHLPVTDSLKWYLKEECLEMQVWLSGRAGHHRSRPSAEDTLLGCCYIPLSGLSPREGDEGRVQGCYPLFKPGVSSLGGGCVQLGLSLQPGRLADCKGLTHEMEISDSSEPPSTVPSSSSAGGKEEEEESVKTAQAELQRQLEAANLFDATLHLHQVVPAREATEGCDAAYAVVHPHPLVECIATPSAPLVPRPSWNHHSKTKMPRELLDPQSLGLQVQVWLKADKGEDNCLGCATVDLSPLSYGMPLLSGWYNVADFAGQCVGQLQVTVVPDAQLRPVSQVHPPLVTAPLVYSSQSVTASRLSTAEVSDGVLQLADKTTSFLLTHLRENMSELEELRDNWTARLKQTQGDVEREELGTGYTTHHVTPAEEGGVHGPEGSVLQLHSFQGKEGEEEEEGSRGFTGSVSQQHPNRVVEEEEVGGGSDTPLSVTPDASGSDEEGWSVPVPAPGCSTMEARGTSEPATDKAPLHREEPVWTRQGDSAGAVPTQEGEDPPTEEEEAPPLSERSDLDSSSSTTSSGSESGSSGSEDEGSEHRSGTALPSGQGPLSTTGNLVQGPRLPNFFLPPQALEENMRALRLAALSRPPPVHPHPPPARQMATDHSSLVSTPERLEQSLEQLLRSYRQGRAAARPRGTPDAKETDRVARIFASKPNVS